MRVSIRLFAALRERAGCDTIDLADVPEGSTIDDLKRLAAAQVPSLGDLGSVAGVVGTAYARPDTVVAEGDEVAFLPPVSGGAPAGADGSTSDAHASAADAPDGTTDLARGVFELSADPLDVAAIQARVAHPSCGAIVLFTGTTRDTNRGQEVVELDYEAFAEMAGPEMERIFSDCLRAHGPDSAPKDPEAETRLRLRMLALHRTGVVGVGEPSVVIAVASPHRDAAFLAARTLIDTLKERLPVWKKEVYQGGHHWIGDRS